MVKQVNIIKVKKKPTKKDTPHKKVVQKNVVKYGTGKTVFTITKTNVIKRKKV
jgi:hypothetical protein